MLSTQTADFASRVWMIASRVGNSAPKITDDIMGEAFPRTCSEARQEGAFKMFRTGVVAEVKRILRDCADADTQRDFAELTQHFAPLVRDLKSKTYFVEAAQEYVSVPDLIAAPEMLDDARKFMRRKGIECLAEADRLDVLYEAVVSHDHVGKRHLPISLRHAAGLQMAVPA